MKIAFLNLYQGKVERGVEAHIIELSSRLSKKHTVDVIPGNSAQVGKWPILWRFFLDPPSINVLVFTLKNLRRLLAKNYDIVIPTNGGWQSLLVRVLTWIKGTKMIVVGHSGIGFDDRINLYCQPDVFVALTNFQRSWAKKINSRVKIVVIPNGVDTSKFNDRQKYDIKLPGPIVLSVGALVKNKRHDLTIYAMSKIPNVSLVVVGKGPERENLHVLGDKILPGRFRIVGLSYDQMPKIYSAANVFVYPTVPWESFGIVMIEAMAGGLPVVANDDPIRREIVGDAGVFVDPLDADSYGKAISNALAKNWKNLPEKQAKKFDWDKIAVEYDNLISEL